MTTSTCPDCKGTGVYYAEDFPNDPPDAVGPCSLCSLCHGRGELGWVVPPPPENIGDIYILYGYCHIPTPRYAVAYRDHAYGDNTGRWVWWLQADDGDCYPWSDVVSQAIWCDGIMLLRRNPMPRWEGTP